MLRVVAPIKSSNKSKKGFKTWSKLHKNCDKKIKIRVFLKLFYKIVQKNDENLGFYFRRGSHLPRKHFKNRLGVQSKSDQVKIQWSDHDKAQTREANSHVIAFWPIVEFSSLSLSPFRQGASSIVEIMFGIIRMKFCPCHLGPMLQKNYSCNLQMFVVR